MAKVSGGRHRAPADASNPPWRVRAESTGQERSPRHARRDDAAPTATAPTYSPWSRDDDLVAPTPTLSVPPVSGPPTAEATRWPSPDPSAEPPQFAPPAGPTAQTTITEPDSIAAGHDAVANSATSTPPPSISPWTATGFAIPAAPRSHTDGPVSPSGTSSAWSNLADERADTPAIEVLGVRKAFGEHVAVDDVSFTVAAGTILGLLGPNGAGKTTTVNMLCTLLKPDAGTAMINGHDVIKDAAAVRRSIMLTGQFAALDEAMTGRENLILFGRLLGLPKPAAARRADELLGSFELTEAAGRRVREYSGGMRRRIDIACGLVTAPKVVFLDEPTTGLDPRSRQEVWRLVENLREQGVTTLLTTQYLEEADVLSDRIVVIDQGRVIADGTARELKASIGTAFYEVTPRNPEDVDRVRGILSDLGARSGETSSDQESSVSNLSVSVPAPDGTGALVEIVRRTTDADVELSDVALRTPTLDEVFLALTGGNRPQRTDAPS